MIKSCIRTGGKLGALILVGGLGLSIPLTTGGCSQKSNPRTDQQPAVEEAAQVDKRINPRTKDERRIARQARGNQQEEAMRRSRNKADLRR